MSQMNDQELREYFQKNKEASMVTSSGLPRDVQPSVLVSVIENMCIINHLPFDRDDLVKSLATLMKYEVELALDPTVSERAHKLLYTQMFKDATGPADQVAPELILLVERYQDMLTPLGLFPQHCPDVHRQPAHLLWMLEQILNNENQTRTKKHRWMGWIQDQMVLQGFTTDKAEQDFSRPILNGM